MSRSTDLDSRAGLPVEWLFLLEEHPRDAWDGHRNLGPMVEFWLARHNGFRQLGATLENLLETFREGRLPANQFAGLLAPRLQHFLGELHSHHMIEDHHYFPIFMTAENRLQGGFELLENDHELIHHRIETVIDSANRFLGALAETEEDRIRRAADSYAETSGALVKGLMRHLDDEEDLIVPLILDRGEHALGVS